MAQVEIRDTSLWTKHIHDGPELKKKLEALRAGQKIWLRVDGKRACFEKMRPGPNGPMPGLKPVDTSRALWRTLYPSKAGQLVELTLDEGDPAAPTGTENVATRTWAQASDVERAAAWEAFKALTKAGWRMEGFAGDRDDLHDY